DHAERETTGVEGKAERLTWHKAWTAVSSGFSISYTSRKLPQNIAVKQAAGRFTRYTQHITDQATGQDMFHTLTGRH
ncbi:hypothetical protein NI895_25180, partial [Escherichia coli]